MDEFPVVVIDLARERRKRFERTRSEEELIIVGFDSYGNPVPLCEKRHRSLRLGEAMLAPAVPSQTRDAISTLEHMKMMLGPHLERLIRTDAGLVRRLGLFPPLRVLEPLIEGGQPDA